MMSSGKVSPLAGKEASALPASSLARPTAALGLVAGGPTRRAIPRWLLYGQAHVVFLREPSCEHGKLHVQCDTSTAYATKSCLEGWGPRFHVYPGGGQDPMRILVGAKIPCVYYRPNRADCFR